MSGRELPAGWTYTTLEKLISSERPLCYGVIQPGDDVSDGNTLIRVCDLVDGSVDTERLRRIAHDVDHQYQRSRVENGDVLVSIVGTIGRVSVVPNELSGSNIARALAKISPNRAVMSAWLAYWLSDHEMQDWLVRESREVARKTLNLGELAQAPVRLAPLAEQRRIVEKIEALATRSRRAREALDTLPALIDRYRQSILAAAFRGDLTAEWRNRYAKASTAEHLVQRLRKEREDRLEGSKKRPEVKPMEHIGVLPESWRMLSLASLAWASSYGTSEKCDAEFLGVPVLRIPNVASGELDFSVLKRANTRQLKNGEAVAPGDLLVVRTNGSRDLLGRGTAVIEKLPEDMSYASYLIRFRLVGGKLISRWINLIWQSPQIRKMVESFAASSAGQYNISMTELAAFPIPIPPPDELPILCDKVESLLLQVSSLAEAHSSSTARRATLDQSILAKAFRGELVPQEPNDEPASVLLERIRAERAAAGPAPRRRRRPKAAGGG
ncbi:restriction endonuclease subunit S [Azospirillum palustre]